MKELVYLSDVRRSILRYEPEAAYIMNGVRKVDAVEVVRCKDCVYWAGGENTMNAYGKTWSCCKYAEKWRAEDDYCSCGERRCDNEVD